MLLLEYLENSIILCGPKEVIGNQDLKTLKV
jgi:hypothetical protein